MTLIPNDYPHVLAGIKARIQASRVRAALAANSELIRLYYSIGVDLDGRLASEAWGSGVVDRLSRDLHTAFPGTTGFSPGNLRRMHRFFRSYTLSKQDLEIWSRLVTESGTDSAAWDRLPWPTDLPNLPWGHVVDLVAKVPDRATRQWYVLAAREHGWSRPVMGLQIDSCLHEREGKALTNFARTLPAPQSDLAQAVTRDPYSFDFLTLTAGANEREVETKLVGQVTQFLLALGVGFAFVGKQQRLVVGGDEFFIDLLFYHLRLRCYVVVELKNVPFVPEFAGKMNFYLSAVDSQLRQPGDQPTIGMILCKSKNRMVAEYALRDVQKPIGIADWQARLTESLPNDLRGSLPTPAELEAELGDDAPASQS